MKKLKEIFKFKKFEDGEIMSRYLFGRIRLSMHTREVTLPFSLVIAKCAVVFTVLWFSISIFYDKHQHDYW